MAGKVKLTSLLPRLSPNGGRRMLKYLKYLNIFQYIPGKNVFGVYRFLPVFFIAGGGLELLMIFWRPKGINFYDTFKKNQSKIIASERFQKWKEIEESLNENVGNN